VSVTTNILQRTFHIRSDSGTGTCFTLDLDGRRYLVSARHVVGGIADNGVVEINHDGRWLPLDVQLVGHAEGNADISVLAPQVLFGAAHPIVASTAHLTLAEDVYFLGFPFGMSFDMGDLNAHFPLPLVKKGIVSALHHEEGLILLDAHNNPGFSGGPVVRRYTAMEQIVIGVVTAYRNQRETVLNREGRPGPYTYDVNTGIVYVSDARHIQNLISRNPIGINVD